MGDGGAVWSPTVPAEAVCRRRISGAVFREALERVCRSATVEIVKRSDQAVGFEVLAQALDRGAHDAWLNRCRRLAKHWEFRTRKALAFLRLASVRIMRRKVCQSSR